MPTSWTQHERQRLRGTLLQPCLVAQLNSRACVWKRRTSRTPTCKTTLIGVNSSVSETPLWKNARFCKTVFADRARDDGCGIGEPEKPVRDQIDCAKAAEASKSAAGIKTAS
jgi:hypothetical protein